MVCEAFSNSYQITYFNKLDKYSYEFGSWLSRISFFISSIKVTAAWQMQSRKSSSHKSVKVLITQSFVNSTQNWVTVTALNICPPPNLAWNSLVQRPCTPIHVVSVPISLTKYKLWNITVILNILPSLGGCLYLVFYLFIYLFIGAILNIPRVGVNTPNKGWTHPKKLTMPLICLLLCPT